MPPPAVLPLFCLASLALLAVPGPAVLYIVARSASQGRRAGLTSVLGVHLGSLVHVGAAAVGLSALLVASATAFTVVRVAGGAYLIVLGVRTWRSGGAGAEGPIAVERPPRRLFADGFVVNVLNPKVALFFLAFLPQFVRPGHGPVWSQTLVLGVLYVGLGLCSDSLYALLAARVGGRLRDRGATRRSRRVEGGLLVGLGVAAVALPHHRTA